MFKDNTIYVEGIIGVDYKYIDFLEDLQDALKSNPNSINMSISSPGGYCDDCDKIINEIHKLSVPLRTRNHGDVASCASILFMMGKTRIYDPSKGVFLIHCPYVSGAEGTADEMLKIVRNLRAQEKKYENIYASVTGVSQEIFSEIMERDEPLTPEEVEKYGLATLVVKDVNAKMFDREHFTYKIAALANLKETEQINNQNMCYNTMKVLAKIAEIIKNLFLVTKDGVELTIDGDELNPGVKIYVEGVPASGSFELNDGTIITAVDGEVTEVQRVSVEEPKEENKVEEPKAEEVIIEEPVVEEPAVEEKKEEVDNAVEELKEKINELVQTVTEMKAQLQESNDKMKAQELVLQNFAKLTSTEKVSAKEDTKDNKSSRFSFKK